MVVSNVIYVPLETLGEDYLVDEYLFSWVDATK